MRREGARRHRRATSGQGLRAAVIAEPAVFRLGVRRRTAGYLARIVTRARGGTLVAAVAVPIAWDGGFDPGAQWAFGLLALAAAALTPAAVRRAPVLLALVVLAALSAASAWWTIGSAEAALRAGIVFGGCAGLAAAASAVAPERLAAGITIAAAATALAGLVAAAALSTPYAVWLEGGWRPAGPFEYPPALALVQVMVLPALLEAMTRARPRLALPAAAAAALAAGVLVLAANRTAIGLATVVAAVALVAAPAPRRLLAAAVGLMVASGLAVELSLGGWVSRHASDAGFWRPATVLTVAFAAGPLWLGVRRLVPPGRPALRRPGARWLVPLGGLAVAVALLTAAPLSDRRFPSRSDVTHGRTWIWHAGLDAWAERPLAGSGAGTFLAATLEHQPGRGRVSRYAHDLPLEQAVELGAPGFLLALVLYAGAALALRRASGTAVRLLGPAVAAFLAANLVDWSWHLAGVTALFALALGGVLGSATRSTRARPTQRQGSSDSRSSMSLPPESNERTHRGFRSASRVP